MSLEALALGSASKTRRINESGRTARGAPSFVIISTATGAHKSGGGERASCDRYELGNSTGISARASSSPSPCPLSLSNFSAPLSFPFVRALPLPRARPLRLLPSRIITNAPRSDARRLRVSLQLRAEKMAEKLSPLFLPLRFEFSFAGPDRATGAGGRGGETFTTLADFTAPGFIVARGRSTDDAGRRPARSRRKRREAEKEPTAVEKIGLSNGLVPIVRRINQRPLPGFPSRQPFIGRQATNQRERTQAPLHAPASAARATQATQTTRTTRASAPRGQRVKRQ